jgi:hypothetical protein
VLLVSVLLPVPVLVLLASAGLGESSVQKFARCGGMDNLLEAQIDIGSDHFESAYLQ